MFVQFSQEQREAFSHHTMLQNVSQFRFRPPLLSHAARTVFFTVKPIRDNGVK